MIIYCEASPVEIYAILPQKLPDKEDPDVIKCMSASLSETEKQYSQIERDLLAEVLNVKETYYSLYGRSFSLIKFTFSVTLNRNDNQEFRDFCYI